MITCKGCGMEISQWATQCSHCGRMVTREDLNGGAPESLLSHSQYTQPQETPHYTSPYTQNTYSGQNTNQSTANNSDFGGFGYDEPIVMNQRATNSYDNFGYDPTKPATKRANRGVKIIAIAFFALLAVTVFALFKSNVFSGGSPEKKAVQKWINAVSDGDPATFLEVTFCPPLLNALTESSNMTKQQLAASLSSAFIGSKGARVKGLKVKVNGSPDRALLNQFETAFNKSGIMLDDVMVADVSFKQKMFGSWMEFEHQVLLYKYDGEIYVIPMK